ncbi:copper chaperone [Metabacillus crassostreae]|uniref:copper chaperone CopZ n=1 Tax=Metabacillus crassostreae TaxID=929098 RepID=UPI00195DC6B7|nr:copper chaperone CopZ [Metabacillus crassostreae]MBM7603741.1 copper chaperone [Metabacillus crassostreae]
MKKIFDVNGMSCGHCVKSIKNSVEKLTGVIHVEVILSEGKVNVEYDYNTVSSAEIKDVIEEQGYDVK